MGAPSAAPGRTPMHSQRPTGRVGLYDPTYEHDACGVAMVARLDGEPSARDRGARRSSRWRTSSTAAPRAPTPTPATAPGSCCSCPTSSSAASSATTCRRRAPTASCVCFLPAGRRSAAPSSRRCSSRRSRPRASASSAGATSRSTRTTSASPPTLRALRQAARRRPRRTSWRGDQDAFERKLYVIRRVAEIAAGPDLVIPIVPQPHDRLQGHADRARSCSATTRTCRTRGRSRRSRSCTRASPRTRSRAGSSRTRTG